MNANEAMLKVAKSMAELYGYVIQYEEGAKLRALDDDFWGNKAAGYEAKERGEELAILTCKYVSPKTEKAKIDIDMHFGNPRLNVSMPDNETFACLTYKGDELSASQSFGRNGLGLAMLIKSQIDFFIKN